MSFINQSSSLSVATQSDQEASTSNVVAVTPLVQKYHPSAVKAWCSYNNVVTTPSITISYNVSSLTDAGVGDCRVNLTTALSALGTQVFSSYDGCLPFIGGSSTASVMHCLTRLSVGGAMADTPYASVIYLGDI